MRTTDARARTSVEWEEEPRTHDSETAAEVVVKGKSRNAQTGRAGGGPRTTACETQCQERTSAGDAEPGRSQPER